MKNRVLTGKAEPTLRRFSAGVPAVRAVCVVLLTLLAAGCTTTRGSRVDPKLGVAPSPRFYGENEKVPKGGGKFHTGRPYVVGGKTYIPQTDPTGFTQVGQASWYGSAFHGRKTANGEFFDQHAFSAAHTTLPLPSYARVTNLENNHSIIVRVNDRGPFAHNRVIDLSKRTAEVLKFQHKGMTKVRVDYVGRASTTGSDDNLLLATLTTDGTPARLKGYAEPTMIASAAPAVAVQSVPVLAYDEPGEDLGLRGGDSDSPELPAPRQTASLASLFTTEKMPVLPADFAAGLY
jgi:rare lipoprotein A